MRAEFAKAMVSLLDRHRHLVFLTGDLGYMALEDVARAYGERFINSGVAEQNAISVAAGLAHEGQMPWVYSMATFTTLRPYAQIRDNVCLQRLPVKLVGNGGGYGYGIMGATHHALEDVAAMRALPHMRIYLPLLASDIADVVDIMAADPLPNYLRLNQPAVLLNQPGVLHDQPFAPWRKLKPGRSCVVVSMGPVVDGLYQASEILDEFEIWSVGTFPIDDIPSELAASIEEKGKVITIEEHGGPGGLGEAFSYQLLTSKIVPRSLTCFHAAGYPSGRYGSQRFHQEESDLRGPGLVARLREVLRE